MSGLDSIYGPHFILVLHVLKYGYIFILLLILNNDKKCQPKKALLEAMNDIEKIA